MSKAIPYIVAAGTFLVTGSFQAAQAAFAITSMAVSVLDPPKKPGAAERQASVTTLSLGEQPRELLVGETCTAGTLVDAFNFGGKYGTDTVTRCIAVADHAIDGVVGYYIGDQYYPWTTDGIQPGFSNKLSIRFYNATAGGHGPQEHVLAAGAGWTNSDRLAGMAVFWIDTQYDEKVWPQGHPQFKFVLRGLRAYDMRFDPALGYTGPEPQTWEDRSSHKFTRNAAVLRYAFTRGIYAEGHHGDPDYLLIGRGLTAEEAPPERIIAAANLCDEIVDGGPRYTANGVIRASDPFITVEEMFAAAMAGQIVQREGGVEVEPGQAKAAAVTINDGALVVGEPVNFSAFLPDTDGGRVNSVAPRYIEPSQGFRDFAGPIRRDLADIATDGGPREATLSLLLVTSGAQADRCAEIMRRAARLERRATIVLPPEYANLEEGDWIAWQSDRYHDGATVRYRIESWTLDEQWRMRLSLREIASSVYGVADPVESVAPSPPPAPVPVDALSLSGVSVEPITLSGDGEGSSGQGAMPALRFKWDVLLPPDEGEDEEKNEVDFAIRAIRAEVRVVGSQEIAPTRTEDVRRGVLVASNGVGPNQVLEARLVPIGDPYRPVLPSAWMTVTTGTLVAGDVSPTSPMIGLINDAIGTVNDAVAANAAAVAAANASVASLNATVYAAGTGLVARTDAMYADINAATTGLKAKTDGLLASLNTPTTGVLARLSAVESSSSGEGSALAGRVSSLEATVNTAGTGITARLAAAESAIASNNSAATSRLGVLEAAVNTAGTGLLARTSALETATSNLATGKADASRVSTVEADLNTPTTGLKARTSAVENATVNLAANKADASRAAALEASVNTPGTGLLSRTTSLETATSNLSTGKADASSLASTNAAVSSLNGTVTAQGIRLTTAEADIAGKASNSALLALTSRVSTAEGDINSVIGNIWGPGAIAARLLSAEGAVTSLQTTTADLATGKANASDLAALTARVTSTEGVNSAQNSRLNTAEADIAGKASASSLTALQAEVIAGRGGNPTLNSRFDQLYAIVVDGDAGKANVSDLTALNARVTAAEGVNSAQNSRLNTAEADIAGKASATALTALQAEVIAGRGGSDSLDSRFHQLYRIVVDADALKADASRVASLEATINTAGTGLSARLVTVEAVSVDMANKLAQARFVLMAEASGGRPAIFGLYSDSRGTSSIQLNAASIGFGDNTTFDDATDTIHTVWSGTRRVISWGAPFGPDSLTEWEGPDAYALSAMSKANARFWRSPLPPYFGAAALTPVFTVNVPAAISRTVVGGSGTITTNPLATSTTGATGSVSWSWNNGFGDPDVSVGGSSTPTFSANPVGVSRKQAIFAWTATDTGTGITRYGTTAVTIQRDA